MIQKHEYQKWIWNYQKRREELRKQYPNWSKSSEYSEKARVLTKKINNWKYCVKRIEQRERKIERLAQDVFEFFGFEKQHGKEKPLMNTVNMKGKNDEYALARMVFYKYAIENGICGAALSQWVGSGFSETAAAGRMRFTRSFKTNNRNRELWHQFKNYINNYYQYLVIENSVAA